MSASGIRYLEAVDGVQVPRLLAPGDQEIFDALANKLTPATDTLTDRVISWVGHALTRAKVSPVAGVDLYFTTLPPFRKLFGQGESESGALDDLRGKLVEFARAELIAGRALPTWESKTPEITPAMKGLVRLSNLRHELRTRAAEWGGERQLLPAGAVERCLVEIDQLVTRHAMQINGVSPSPRRSQPPA
jgi:hypothetical protein